MKILLSFLVEASKENKVRRVFRVPGHDDWLLMYVTNQISIGDRVVANFKGKGLVLNAIAVLVKKMIEAIIPTDLVTADDKEIAGVYGYEKLSPNLKGRLCLVKKAMVIPFECIVRIFLEGSLFRAYEENGYKAGWYLGHYLPAGMKEGDRLPIPIFTPSTKAPAGQHDQNINYDKMVCGLSNWMKKNNIIGWDPQGLAQAIRSSSLAVALSISSLAEKQGLVFRDTKFEFGLIPILKDGKIIGYTLVIIDEAMTPDSSRITEDGRTVCKQFARNYSKKIEWDGESKIAFPEEFQKEFIENYRMIQMRMKNISLFTKRVLPFIRSLFVLKCRYEKTGINVSYSRLGQFGGL